MASRISTKSARWATRSSSRAASSSSDVVGEDHPPHDGQAVLGDEHVLGPAQTDPLGPEGAGVGGVRPVVGVGPHGQMPGPDLVGPTEDDVELLGRLGRRTAAPGRERRLRWCRRRRSSHPRDHRDRPTVKAFPWMRTFSAPTTAGLPQPRATTAAWRHEAAAGGEDPLGGQHPVDVLGRGLAAHQDHLLAAAAAAAGVVGGEVDTAHRRARRGPEAAWSAPRAPIRRTAGWSTCSRCSAGDSLRPPPPW